MITFQLGILGCGKIADRVAETLTELEGFTVKACAAREEDRAKDFAERHGIERAYGSYEKLIADPDVELIYITTVNSNHAELAKLCLEGGKPVLVEKPFSYNLITADEVLKLSEEKRLFCGEAMWLRYQPMLRLTCDLIHRQKLIGDVRYISANIGYDLRAVERLKDPALAGGALLDVGIYPITAVFMLMNALPVSFISSYSRLSTGVDGIETINMNFANGAMATIFSTMMMETDKRCVIYGTGGRVEIDNINAPEQIRVYNPANELVQSIDPPERQISGYEYQFLAAREAVIVGRTETPENTHNHIRMLCDFTDKLRKAWGVKFPLPGEEETHAPAAAPDGKIPGTLKA